MGLEHIAIILGIVGSLFTIIGIPVGFLITYKVTTNLIEYRLGYLEKMVLDGGAGLKVKMATVMEELHVLKQHCADMHKEE